MSEKTRYPQIPSTVWWGVRAILQKSPNITFDEKLLGVQLEVQDAAAKAYLVELKSVGLLTEEGKSTALAQKWRLDDSYQEAVEKILSATYPEGLLQISPPEERNRQKAVSWFLREGLGQGAAGNKAATYLLISSPTPNEAPSRNANRASDQGSKATNTAPKTTKVRDGARNTGKILPASSSTFNKGNGNNGTGRTNDSIPLNINVQIHISADAGSEQIESIFSAMKRYLNEDKNN